MLKDYFTYDGVEMANAKRAFVYSRNLDVPWVEETAVRCPNLFYTGYLGRILPADALINPNLWVGFGYGYTWPQPAPTVTSQGLLFSWNPTPSQDHGGAFQGVRAESLSQSIALNSTYRVTLRVSSPPGSALWRPTIGYVASGTWASPDGTTQTRSFDWVASTTTPSFGIEVAKPATGWADAGTHLVESFVVELLGEPVLYTTPEADGAPWYDATDPDTAKFCGVVVTSVSGGEDSTHEASIVEAIDDGGTVSPSRHGTRSLVFTALLVGQNESAVQSGLGWLEGLLHGGDPCRTTPRWPGEHPELEFYSSCPTECSTGTEGALRTMYDAHLVRGPLVISNPKMSRGALMEVTFTITSHNPYVWGQPYSVTDDISQFDYDFLAATYSTYNEVAGAAATYDEFVEVLWQQYLGDQWGGAGVGSGTISVAALPDSFYDPDCTPLPAFPEVPQTTTLCRDLTGTTWKRAAFVVGRDDVPQWAPSLPVMTLSADVEDHKDIRVRFTPGTGDPDSDYVMEWLVAYLPAGGTLELHGPKNRIDLTSEGVTARAAHLVSATSSDGDALFPVIRCGVTYQVTVDVRDTETQTDVTIGMSLVRRDY